MNLVKFVLVFFVLCICLTGFKPLIETFYPQVQGLPYNQEPINEYMYMNENVTLFQTSPYRAWLRLP